MSAFGGIPSAPQVDTAVYVLEKHAKYLAKELLMPCGKGSDASNLNDEEESEEEYFSDDKKVSRNIQTRNCAAKGCRATYCICTMRVYKSRSNQQLCWCGRIGDAGTLAAWGRVQHALR